MTTNYYLLHQCPYCDSEWEVPKDIKTPVCPSCRKKKLEMKRNEC